MQILTNAFIIIIFIEETFSQKVVFQKDLVDLDQKKYIKLKEKKEL